MCSEQGPETTRIRDRDPSSTVYSTTKNVVENTENIKTDRQTDGQTDRRNKYILGLPNYHDQDLIIITLSTLMKKEGKVVHVK